MLKCLQMDASGWESRCDQVWLYQTASLSTFETSNIGQVSSLQLKVATSSLLLSFRLTFSLSPTRKFHYAAKYRTCFKLALTLPKNNKYILCWLLLVLLLSLLNANR